jgi:hypothetical protein
VEKKLKELEMETWVKVVPAGTPEGEPLGKVLKGLKG